MANTLKFGNGQWAVKEGSTLAYNDENNNFKPLPFNFERNSRATVVNKDGLIETVGSGQPRIDYKDDSKGALLLEPQRTNLVTYSEDFSNASWYVNSGSVTGNELVSPDGTMSADKVVFINSGTAFIDNNVNIGYLIASNTFVVSFWVYSDIEINAFCRVRGLGATTEAENIPYTILTGWNRYDFIKTFTSSADGSSIKIAPLFDGDLTNNTLYIWGAQLEQGSYATSYIPTQGSTVTRLADVCNGAGNEQVFNDSEGVLFAEISALANDGTNRRIAISDGDNTDRISIGFTSSNRIQFIIQSNNSIQVNTSITVPKITENTKVSFKYKANDCAFWIDGFELGTDTIATMPSGLNVFSFDEGNGGNNFYGNTKQIQYYNTALTDAELKALTS